VKGRGWQCFPPIAMNRCSCGNPAEENSALCARCSALQLLELGPSAAPDEIEQAFQVLSKAWGPERYPNDATMQAVAEQKLAALRSGYSYVLANPPSTTPPKPPVHDLPFSAAAYAVAEPAQEKQSSARSLGYAGTTAPRFSITPTAFVLGFGGVLVLLLVAWLLFKPMDDMLMSKSATARVYGDWKLSVRSAWQRGENTARDTVHLPSHQALPPLAEPTPAPAQPTGQPNEQAAGGLQRSAKPRVGAAAPAGHRVMPVITVGMSESEVIAAQGAPTSQSADKLVYGQSELYFSKDSLVGWKIDVRTPLHAKIWPDAPVDPDLEYFGVGSTKNDVIALEGTPTLYSENTFGYGPSQVTFKNNRVVSWKSDPIARLHVAER
jgi:hypothetical protein